MAMALSPEAHALDWDFQPYVSGSVTYTDNQNQSENNPKDAVILTATPGFSLVSKGSRRVRAGMNFGLTGVARFGDDLDNEFYSNLNALGNAELVEDFLFIDATATISQQLISLSGSQTDAAINSNNRTTTSTYSISPYVQKRFSNFADAVVRFTQSGSYFEDNAFNNINSSEIDANLVNGTRFNNLSWGLNYYWRDATISNSENTRFESYGGNLGYELTRKFRLLGTLGYDNNDYAAAPGSEISGTYWTAGFGWAPNRRTNLDASFGESYFGRTYDLNFNYRTRDSVWTASYTDGVNDISQQLLNTQSLVVWSCDGGLFYGDSVLPPPGQTNCVLQGNAPIGSVPVGLSNGVYLSKSLLGAVAWSKGKTSIGLNVFDTLRQYLQLEGLPDDEIRGINLSGGYRLNPLTTLNAFLGYSNYQSAAGLNSVQAEDTDYYTGSLGVSRQFGRDLSGALIVRHQRHDSNLPNNSYDENSVTASASMTF
ncbi:MAG: TIGR03016 family PEP-CTERM system-associated outer membrane protein [Thiobacillus sp.]|nr:TIGR03016 family PEP-CTERM system-associated outer membrane protein [Thiobacillus sp.]